MLSPLAHKSPTPANTPTLSTNNAARAYAAQTSRFRELRPAQASSVGNPVRGNVTWALQGDRRARRDTEETQAEARVRCLVRPERRSPVANVFHSFLTGANTEPRGSSATREAPQSPFGGLLQRDARAPHLPVTYLPPTVGQARQLLPTAARIPRSWQRLAAGHSRVQGGRRIPGYKRRRQRARPAAAVGRLKMSERRIRARAGVGATASGVGAGGWGQGWGGTDARGARPSSRGRRRAVFWLPRLLNAS